MAICCGFPRTQVALRTTTLDKIGATRMRIYFFLFSQPPSTRRQTKPIFNTERLQYSSSEALAIETIALSLDPFTTNTSLSLLHLNNK